MRNFMPNGEELEASKLSHLIGNVRDQWFTESSHRSALMLIQKTSRNKDPIKDRWMGIFVEGNLQNQNRILLWFGAVSKK